ncbi:MAG: hypothetical protein ABIQ31_16505 [Ferruginibacter sp.]
MAISGQAMVCDHLARFGCGPAGGSVIQVPCKEKDPSLRSNTMTTIKKALEYNLRITSEVSNPFGYAKQRFVYQDKVQNGFLYHMKMNPAGGGREKMRDWLLSQQQL